MARALHDPFTVRRFWQKVQKTDGCWLWTGAKQVAGGYGVPGIGTGLMRATHISFAYHHGHVPRKQVNHHCDNPACVRPDHIYDGSHKQNMDDMTARGNPPS